ncbi:MAG: ABC transporter substrate-binding protein [bacterium]|nr:ABC transporter substrate-binding protein [bacterium]MDA1292226.1 ABC transporter substrate-binding protein [bacterium]
MDNGSFRALATLNQKTLLGIFGLVFFLMLIFLLRKFHAENTVTIPTAGGTYIEGSVGEMQPLIPWFTVQNDVNRDILSLVNPGLLKYDPESKNIKDDLATLLVSNEGRIYTVKLKEGLQWHDSTPENPHPVTADDVLFNFKTIQDAAFPNPILQQNFLGVDIQKMDDRTIQFRLDDPYSFFASNLTLGLVPESSFTGVPIAKLEQVLDFGFAPIGAGPYKFKSLVQTELSTEMTLERFARPVTPEYRLEQIIFRIFPDYSTLLSDIRNLDGIRHVPRNDSGQHLVPRRFKAVEYFLPQYVALFFNLDHAILEDRNLRIGLQLGTNKQELVEHINEYRIVDTPLMELDSADWRYTYDPEAAQGAFFESNWHLPEKVRLQRLLEIHEANSVGPLQIAPIVLLDTGAILSVTGSLLDAPIGSTLNGLPLYEDSTQTGSWIAALPTYGGTGSLKMGNNLIRLIDPDGNPIDSFYVWRTDNGREYKRASVEQDLVDRFIDTRKNSEHITEENRITIANLFLEKGMIRERLSTDPQDIRVNDVGDRLSLTLLTSPSPPQYRTIAEDIAKQWAALGVHVGVIIPESRQEFEEKLLAREYDVFLFGQSLLDNLDAYPYWHSSGMQKLTDSKFDLRIDAYNLSQYSSIAADGLLEVIRQTGDDKERQDALSELQETLQNDVPAIFLYTPYYAFAYHEQVKGIQIGALSLHSDRFTTLHDWFLKEALIFKPGKNWWNFIPWLFTLI